jgi:thiamine pyrophosphate-dependent acetolactate synthase large subunit-like protein
LKKQSKKIIMESSVAKPPFDLNLGDEDDSTALEKFENLANLISSKKNIVVLVGAGISTACGIPDFRTKGSGLYSTIENEREL